MEEKKCNWLQVMTPVPSCLTYSTVRSGFGAKWKELELWRAEGEEMWQLGKQEENPERAGKEAVRWHLEWLAPARSGRAELRLLRAPFLKIFTGVFEKLRQVPCLTHLAPSWLERNMFTCLRSLSRNFQSLRYSSIIVPGDKVASLLDEKYSWK